MERVYRDKTAIQAVITAAAAAGKNVYVPSGTYHMHETYTPFLSILPVLPSERWATSIFSFQDTNDNAQRTGLAVMNNAGNVRIVI